MEIREYMKHNKIKNQDFAKIIGISDAYLSQLCSGARKPSKYVALMIEAKTKGIIKANKLRPDIKKLA